MQMNIGHVTIILFVYRGEQWVRSSSALILGEQWRIGSLAPHLLGVLDNVLQPLLAQLSLDYLLLDGACAIKYYNMVPSCYNMIKSSVITWCRVVIT